MLYNKTQKEAGTKVKYSILKTNDNRIESYNVTFSGD